MNILISLMGLPSECPREVTGIVMAILIGLPLSIVKPNGYREPDPAALHSLYCWIPLPPPPPSWGTLGSTEAHLPRRGDSSCDDDPTPAQHTAATSRAMARTDGTRKAAGLNIVVDLDHGSLS